MRLRDFKQLLDELSKSRHLDGGVVAGGELVNVGPIHIEDVSVEETWAKLKVDPRSTRVAVRNTAQLAFVGVPGMTSLRTPLLAAEWQTFPDRQQNAGFARQLGDLFEKAGAQPEDEVICRSGGRGHGS